MAYKSCVFRISIQPHGKFAVILLNLFHVVTRVLSIYIFRLMQLFYIWTRWSSLWILKNELWMAAMKICMEFIIHCRCSWFLNHSFIIVYLNVKIRGVMCFPHKRGNLSESRPLNMFMQFNCWRHILINGVCKFNKFLLMIL